MTIRTVVLLFALLIPSFGPSVGPLQAEEDHSSYQSDRECRRCHKMARPSHRMTHPGKAPQDLPLSSSGRMTCLTCHDCSSGRCVLRKELPALCWSCHDCTQGMACIIGVVHMGDSPHLEQLSSSNCLACHDGSVGKLIFYEKAGISGSRHRIGMSYSENGKLKHVTDRRVVFINGRVTCISCHNPYTRGKKKVVKSNSGSALCLTCHRK